ncbi:Listeria/Bacterioides repeat-containing protein [Natronincola peptidivorans]|uniref:Listeria/Bacterioides repeat-containing protein n=1 Tax=Natronincola peptidivorans TaxID=426128 RepID=A0A1I0C6G6_9FIRM|nr:S-layer homology domain-containing protein [Natronincola peptidivorans]SET15019.1 Listeria/Bacterioides repeat-containing protein [Natronincola peptidivorans]
MKKRIRILLLVLMFLLNSVFASAADYFLITGNSMNPVLKDGDVIQIVSEIYADGDMVVAQLKDDRKIVKRLMGDHLVSVGEGTSYPVSEVTILGAAAYVPMSLEELEMYGFSWDSVLAEGVTIVEISAGSSHSLALTSTGEVYAWGDGGFGQLGNGEWTNQMTPVKVADGDMGNTGVTAISAGGQHSLAIKDGVVYAWGYGGSGRLGNGEWINQITPVKVADGAMVNAGVTAISAGVHHSLALKGEVVYAWGSGESGRLGNSENMNQSTPVRVADGAMINEEVTAISTGVHHSLALKSGVVYAWGKGDDGQLGNGDTEDQNTPVKVADEDMMNTGVTAISAGSVHSLALKGGVVYAWGQGMDGRRGDGISNYHIQSTPVRVADGAMINEEVTAISAGGGHSLAIKGEGVYAWGFGMSGQLGNSSTSSEAIPVKVADGNMGNTKVIAISAGNVHSLALKNGEVYAWGYGMDGQLGNGSTSNQSTPVKAESNNAYLSGLSFSMGTLDPAFDKETTAYTSSVAYNVDSITVIPTVEHGLATVKINNSNVAGGQASDAINLNVGANIITVEVTAQDKTTTKTYTITVTRDPYCYLTVNPSTVSGNLNFSQQFTISINNDTVTGSVYKSDLSLGGVFSGLSISTVDNTSTTVTASVYGTLDKEGTGKIIINKDKLTTSAEALTAEVTVNLLTVTYNGNGNTGGMVPIDNKYPAGASVTVLGNTGNLTKTGYTFAGWSTQADGKGTGYNSSDIFTMGTANATLYAVWTAIPTGGGGGGGGTPTPTPAPAPSQVPGPSTTETETTVIVNGQKQIAGTETVTEENEQKIVELRADSNILNKIIDQVLKDSETDGSTTENIVEIPVAAKDAQQIKTILTGDIIKKMAQKDFSLAITTEKVDYFIPVKAIAIEEIASVLEVGTDSLKDIDIEVQINHLREDQVKELKEKAQAKSYEILFPPVEFKILAKTTSATGAKKETTITQFSSYAPRVMEIPAGVDPQKITTGVVYNPDGTFSHIPTTVFEKEGKWYAKLSSITNSIYTIIRNPVTVASVENHWSRKHVNDMASRLIIKNPETFTPNGAISRGEFAEYITKALGLYRTGASKAGKFTDVDITNELADAITIATEYGIITGYPDGSFRPEAQISRQEAMTMYAKAMDIVGLKEGDSNRIDNYIDKDQVADWAYQYVKKTISAGVFNGRTHTTIDPKGTFTYAEAATAIRNLLTKSHILGSHSQ